jgi:hypothetical protein
MRSLFCLGVVIVCSNPGTTAQEPVRLAERFDPSDATHVEVKVSLAGRLAVPDDKGQVRAAPVAGTSSLSYDERPLPSDRPDTQKLVRVYQGVKFDRTVDGRPESADLRPEVRRVVVQRNPQGRKAAFCPAGPLTAGEVDAIRTDLYSPALVPGLLSVKPVRPGDRWAASAAAVADLTDFDPITGGELTVTFTGVVSPNGKPLAKLGVQGTVSGSGDDGPARQTFEGVAYFDLQAERLSYLNLAGTQQLLTDGKVTGEVRGTLVVTRGPAARPLEIGEAVRETTATDVNTRLLFDEPALGVRFVYPRRWRVGPGAGRQITLDEPAGGGLLLTVEPTGKLPTGEQFRREIVDFLKGQKWPAGEPTPVRKSGAAERFGVDAEANGQKVRLEYAVVAGPAGGVTVAARLPWADRDARTRELDAVLATLTLAKPR